MNPLERIRAAHGFLATDRIPVVPQVFGHAAVVAGVSLVRYLTDGELLARCQIEALSRYGYDAVFALLDACVESEALGSTLLWRDHLYPSIERHVLADGDLSGLSVPDPKRSGRMPQLLEGARILRREVGAEVLVVGCVLGPVTLALQLLGTERGLFLAVDEPERFEAVLDFSERVAIAFGLAQIEAGVHLPMVFDPAASPAVIPPQFFRELELPRLARIFSAFRTGGALANFLHIAGPTEKIYPYYPHLGVGIANVDYPNDPRRVRELLPETCLIGNVKPLSFVSDTPEEIAAAAQKLVDLFTPGGGFILSSGCEIPLETRPENVEAMVNACRGRG